MLVSVLLFVLQPFKNLITQYILTENRDYKYVCMYICLDTMCIMLVDVLLFFFLFAYTTNEFSVIWIRFDIKFLHEWFDAFNLCIRWLSVRLIPTLKFSEYSDFVSNMMDFGLHPEPYMSLIFCLIRVWIVIDMADMYYHYIILFFFQCSNIS